MKRIYTKTGDQGMTRIRGGVELPKDDILIEVNGTLDELNAILGIVRSFLPVDHRLQTSLQALQVELLGVMSHIATPVGKTNPKVLQVEAWTLRMEQEIDASLAVERAPAGFVLPGGSLAAAHLHFARTVARRAERRLCTLQRRQPIAEGIFQFVNRLSDWLFIQARLV